MKRIYGQGKILKSEIRRNGLRIRFVGEKAGIPYSTFDAYVNDRQGIPELTLRGILQMFPAFKTRLFDFNADQPQQKLALMESKTQKIAATNG